MESATHTTIPSSANSWTLINRQLRGGTLCIRDTAGYPIHYVSESLARHLGYRTAAELIACVNGKWSNLICLDEVDEAEKTMRPPSFTIRKNSYVNTGFGKKDGEYIWIRENGKYSHDESNGKKLVALCVDITDTKNAEEKAQAIMNSLQTWPLRPQV